MRLELKIHEIHDVQFARRTSVDKGVLYVDPEELVGFLKEDRSLGEIEIQLARPGEKCRIIRVCDIVEPRAKALGSGVDFPGALGAQLPAGSGITNVLRGAGVVMAGDKKEGGVKGSFGEIIDMSGPSAQYNIYATNHNIVVTPHPSGAGSRDYQLALKKAGLKTAAYLARTACDVEPDHTEVYELPSFYEKKGSFTDLPRVAYVFPVFAQQFGELSGKMVLYGNQVVGIVPTVLHPNEVFDGAIVSPSHAVGLETYAIQNHPVIKELYSKHNKELFFCGVILTATYNSEDENLRAATMVGNLAKWTLDADGVVLTKPWGGAAEMAVAQTAKRCEEMGIKTVLAMWQQSVDYGSGIGTLFNFEEVDAIVSLGLPEEALTLPPVDRVIGQSAAPGDSRPIEGEIVRGPRNIRGYLDMLGFSRQRSALY